jgi:hypothetical protein
MKSWLEEVSDAIQEKHLCPDCAKKDRCKIYRDYGEKALGCTGYRQAKPKKI